MRGPKEASNVKLLQLISLEKKNYRLKVKLYKFYLVITEYLLLSKSSLGTLLFKMLTVDKPWWVTWYVITISDFQIPRFNAMRFFFLFGYLKHKVFVSSLSQELKRLKQHISFVLDSLTWDMLAKVWQVLDCRNGNGHVTECAHIEHL